MQTPTDVSRYLKAAACAAVVVCLCLLIWFASDVLLLAFAGILLAIVLRAAAETVGRYSGLSSGWSLLIVLVVLALVLAGAVSLAGSHVVAEMDQLRTELPRDWGRIESELRSFSWGRDLLDNMSRSGGLLVFNRPGGRILSAFSTIFAAIASIVIVFFVGLYLAVEPDLYRRGFLQLVPASREKRAREVLDRVGNQLRRWITGKLALMLFVGIFTGLGLWFLHMPLVMTLAAIAALLDFIPNIGPLVSAIPALLIASTKNTTDVLWVAALYLAVQFVESYILQPLVQRRVVSLPPSVTLIAQGLIGTLFGITGLVLATPLTVVAMTATQMLYVRDYLGKRSEN